jgi:hypothetical protein
MPAYQFKIKRKNKKTWKIPEWSGEKRFRIKIERFKKFFTVKVQKEWKFSSQNWVCLM